MSSADRDTGHRENFVPFPRRFGNGVRRVEWRTPRCGNWRQLLCGKTAFGVSEDHPAVGEYDIEIRIACGLHQKINVQVVCGRIEIGPLSSRSDLTAGVHAAHRDILYWNACLAGEAL